MRNCACQHCLQGIQLNSYRTFLETVCKRGVVACVFARQVLKTAGMKKVLHSLSVLSAFVLPSRQSTWLRGLFVSSDWNISRMSVI